MKKTSGSQPARRFLCSELVTLKAGRRMFVGNLEEIERHECSVLVDARITAGTAVRLESVDCPRRARGQGCSRCRFGGKVEGQEEDAQLGRVTRISLHGRLWSRSEWQPRHLTDASQAAGTLWKPDYRRT